MAAPLTQDKRDRIKSAAGVGFLHALLGYAFVTGLGFDVVAEVGEELKIFNVAQELPPPPVELPPADEERSERRQTRDPEGAASPANLKDTPSPIVAPEPEIVIPVPPPVIAAPAAGQGNADSAGATDVPGPGTGAGGIGTGLGSWRHGDGTGGGGGGWATPVRWISGRIRDRDYPRSALEAGISGTVFFRFVVGRNGRVTECDVTESSGNAALDATTCRIFLQRFRYRPARDAGGRPVPQELFGEHVWETDRRMTHVEIDEPADE